MTSDFILCMRVVLEQSFRLFNSFLMPGVNFSPAVLMFGIASFGLAIILIKGIITITSSGLHNSAYAYVSKGQAIKSEKRSRK